jgi:hypothetical protein
MFLDSVIVMDEAAIERLRIAVRILNLHYDRSGQVTEAEIDILKSYLGGDLVNVAVEDIATAVIRRELDLEPSNRRKIKRSASRRDDPNGT